MGFADADFLAPGLVFGLGAAFFSMAFLTGFFASVFLMIGGCETVAFRLLWTLRASCFSDGATTTAGFLFFIEAIARLAGL